MATLDYVDIPSSATRLHSLTPSASMRPQPKITVPLPHPSHAPTPLLSPSTTDSPFSPSFTLSHVLLAGAIPNAPTTPRARTDAPRLVSTKDPLSIPITTVNFKRFVGKAGPVFWVQDRLEEVVMWRRGNRYTGVWIAGYAFLCYFPRLFLLLPLLLLLGTLLALNPSLQRDAPELLKGVRLQPPPASTSEWSTDWLSNVQAIQNLMGVFSDAHDLVSPAITHLNYTSPYTPVILTLTALVCIVLIPLVQLLPLRLTFLTLGLLPLSLTHPFTRTYLLPLLLQLLRPRLKAWHVRLTRLIDNDRLEDRHWRSELREVFLWENERWAGVPGVDDGGAVNESGWSKANLRPGERRAWTRGRDGWSGVAEDGSGDVSSNLTFSLAPGWLFVETEDWRPDLEGTWVAPLEADDNGWVYTNDTWMDARSLPLEEWRLANGLTRRRRWVRRIYYDPTLAA
ncbi:hypothetical protein BDW22DRAFT_1487362 [Trametopsis cervina]|nr:hypothetical protein BDW22DRAFT_1487362 [Trametopsis cervina]